MTSDLRRRSRASQARRTSHLTGARDGHLRASSWLLRLRRKKGTSPCLTISTRRWRLRPASCTSTTCTCSPARAARCSSWTSTPTSTACTPSPASTPRRAMSSRCTSTGPPSKTLTWRVSFAEPDADGQQALRLHTLTGEQAREDSAAGELVLEGRTGQAAARGRGPAVGRTDRRLVLHRPVAAGHHQRRGGRRAPRRTCPSGGRTRRPEQLRWHHRRLDRARGLPPAPAARPRRPHRRMGRHQAGHRRRRLAADQPRRAPDDVADLLAERHRLLQPGQHPAPVGGRQRRRQVHRRADRRPGGGRRHQRRPGRVRPGSGRGTCSPTCCPT